MSLAGEWHTHRESKHVWQGSRGIVDYMKLAGLEQYVPEISAFAEGFVRIIRIVRE